MRTVVDVLSCFLFLRTHFPLLYYLFEFPSASRQIYTGTVGNMGQKEEANLSFWQMSKAIDTTLRQLLPLYCCCWRSIVLWYITQSILIDECPLSRQRATTTDEEDPFQLFPSRLETRPLHLRLIPSCRFWTRFVPLQTGWVGLTDFSLLPDL